MCWATLDGATGKRLAPGCRSWSPRCGATGSGRRRPDRGVAGAMSPATRAGITPATCGWLTVTDTPPVVTEVGSVRNKAARPGFVVTRGHQAGCHSRG